MRRATHAGTWYSREALTLKQSLQEWLEQANVQETSVKAIIGPHAGFSYSGSTAAWAYKVIQPNIKRIILLGPSHKVYFKGCALPSCVEYETPFGPIRLDTETLQQLETSEAFLKMSLEVDEQEHSLEMHLPWIKLLFPNVVLVPILVGELDATACQTFTKILTGFLQDSIVVVSSDFCHWGQRFGYTPISHHPIHASIQALDQQGMDAICSMDPKVFKKYLDETGNTICGRFPIYLLMHLFQGSECKFISYKQSSQVTDENGSSVSYAAAYIS